VLFECFNAPTKYECRCPQEVAQSAGITPNEVEVISSNPHPPSYVDMSKKKKKMNAVRSRMMLPIVMVGTSTEIYTNQ
jgi:hypothetical protein